MNIDSIPDETPLIKIIGSYVKQRRLQKNISQVELAERSGISMASITRFETGKGNISLQNLISILKILGLADELKVFFLSQKKIDETLHSRVRWSKKLMNIES
jgi:transcriptional regulator with XRE-family HTH domain